MTAPQPESEDRPAGHTRMFDLQSRLDDAVDPQEVTVFPQHADQPSEEWLTIDADFVVPVDEAI